MDNDTTIYNIKKRIKDFDTERDWDQYHHPKELAISISLEAAELLQRQGIHCSVINARFVKPIDINLISNIETDAVFTVEEGVLSGGFGSSIQEILGREIYRIGLPDNFICHGSRDILLDNYGLSSKGIFQTINKCLK